MEKFLIANGCALRIFDSMTKSQQETKPVMFLLHGYFESIEVWDRLIPYLKNHFRVVAMDIPGHGVSQVMGEVHSMEAMADTAKAVLDELGIEKCTVVGHSMGGYVTLAMAKKYPEKFTSLVMLHSRANADSEEKKINREREIELVLAGKKDMLAKTTPFKGFALGNRKRFSDAIEELEDQIFLTDEDGVVALLRGMAAREDLNEMLATSGIPYTFIFGEDDEYIPMEAANETVAQHPKAKVHFMAKSGHMSLIEQTEELAEILVGLT